MNTSWIDHQGTPIEVPTKYLDLGHKLVSGMVTISSSSFIEAVKLLRLDTAEGIDLNGYATFKLSLTQTVAILNHACKAQNITKT